MKKILFSVFAAVAIMSCSQSATTTTEATTINLDSAKAGINAANAVFTESLGKGDSATVGSLYAKDACLLFAGMPSICGQDAIISFMGGAKRMGIGTIKLDSVEFWAGKEVVTEQGTYEMVDPAGTTMEKGKYIAIWKQEDRKWKMIRDMSNSDSMPGSK